jgi:hypothetical protein
MVKVRKKPKRCLACGRILNNKEITFPLKEGRVHGWGDCAYEINRENRGQINIKRIRTQLKDLILDGKAF